MGKALSALESQRRALETAGRVAMAIKRVCDARGITLVGVYLVGSRARGDYGVWSDIDVVVVAEDIDDVNIVDRMRMFAGALEPGVDLRVYSRGEWCSSSPWMEDMRRTAKPLLGPSNACG